MVLGFPAGEVLLRVRPGIAENDLDAVAMVEDTLRCIQDYSYLGWQPRGVLEMGWNEIRSPLNNHSSSKS